MKLRPCPRLASRPGRAAPPPTRSLRRWSGLSAVLLAIPLALLGAGCGDDGGTGGTGGEDGGGARPPARGEARAGDGPGLALAMDRIFLGETTRDGTRDANAWKSYGYDIDRVVADGSGEGLCVPQDGAEPQTVHVDGEDGRDNAFGKSILPVLELAVSNPSETITDAITDGTFTMLLSIEGLGDASDYAPLETKLYGGDTLGSAPEFDGTDEWPLLPELLEGGDPERPKVRFPESYVVGGTWVSGPPSPVTIGLSIAGFPVRLTIEKAVMTMQLSEDRQSASEGTLAGVLETEELVNELRRLLTGITDDYCDPSSLEPIFDSIRRASDIMKDGTQDGTSECNAISIGIGFSMKKVELGPVGDPADPIPSKCAG